MAGKRSIFSGVLTVIVLSCLVFVVIFFFYPTVSMKYFGTAFNPNKAVASTIGSVVSDADYLNAEQKKVVSEYLNSKEGQEIIGSLTDAAKKGGDAVEKALESEEVQKMKEEISSKLTKENLDTLMENLSDVSSDLISRFTK